MSLDVIAKFRPLIFLISAISVGACTTVSVDHVQLANRIDIAKGESIVILGRHHSAEFETEPSLVSCVGDRIQNGATKVSVIPEKEFTDGFYPYFESRIAPLKIDRLKDIFAVPLVKQKLQTLDLRYMIWIEGSTERTGSAGSMSCTIAPNGAACFGFGTLEDTSDYEAIIWDVQNYKEVARVSTEAIGTSYIPAFVIPLPLLARVQANACQGMGTQLVEFFEGGSTGLKVRPQ
ncbi:MAG: hypothetical protein P8I38_15345 [Arenicella sp.]|jgi:hypothetical protein|nr:hypothetical protein [Arenicella sp.]